MIMRKDVPTVETWDLSLLYASEKDLLSDAERMKELAETIEKDYKGRLKMEKAPKWIQGVAYYDGDLYVTSDDGDAEEDAPDHMYRIEVSDNKQTGKVSLEKTFDDVTRQGEIEGLSFDKNKGEFLLLYNRGARIIAGMPKGFYEGYSEEIHEVFVYDIEKQ